MISIQQIEVMNFKHAIRGMRNPMSSWDLSDSDLDEQGNYRLGPNDLKLASKLCAAGSDHRKFLRQIIVSMDINAPLYWWKEFDTYKVATVANSTSTMHKIHAKPFELQDFSTDHMNESSVQMMEQVIGLLEELRQEFLKTKDKQCWYSMIQLLPSSYHQLRTCTLNYETLRNIYASRKHHKLKEWHDFCEIVESLPYAAEFIL